MSASIKSNSAILLDDETLITDCVCKECNNVLPPHTVSCHLDVNHPIHKCPHGKKSEYTTLASILYSSSSIINETITDLTINIPIKTIDAVPVTVTLVYNYHGMRFKVESLDYYTDETREVTEQIPLYSTPITKYKNKKNISIEEIETMLRVHFEEISKLKFSVFNGRFYSDKIIDESCWGFLTKFENLTLDFDECCVCKEITKSKTACKHTLCRPCMFKIKPSPVEDADDEYVLCPICRETL